MISSRDTFDRYLHDIAVYSRITPQREDELSRVIRTDPNEEQVEAAIHELVQANLRLVVHCLKDFEAYLRSPGVHTSRMDLIAEGNVALMNSARNFNSQFDSGDQEHTTPMRFSNYACKSIKCAMHRALKLARIIHVPEYHFGHWTEMKALQEEYGDTLTDDILMDKLEVNPAVLRMLKVSQATSTCMLEDLGAADDDGAWESFLPNDQASCPARETDQRDLRRFLLAELQKLPPRTAHMLQLMFLGDSRPTLTELAHEFGISAERCRQVCLQGLTTLRKQLLDQVHRIDPSLPAAEVAA